MAYTQTAWQNQPSTATPVSATNLNNLETQYSESMVSFSGDLYQPFVLSGIVATKDGSVANKLDVTAGVIYLKQSADGSMRRLSVTSTNFTTSTINTTYYLDIYPVAGSEGVAPSYGWSFATSHTGNPNYYTIATVNTDGSGNIKSQGGAGSNGVVDQRAFVGAGLLTGPNVGKTTGGLLAMVYDMPSSSASDVPGIFLGCQIVGPIDWTGFTFSGQESNFYLRIVGLIKPTFSETYTFYLTADDAVRGYVGDTDLFGETGWKGQSPTTYSGTVGLTAGNWYPIIIEYFQGGSSNTLQLEWQSTSQARQDVPSSAMMWQWPSETVLTARSGFFHYNLKVAGNTVWHAGNDGSGSGLDADLIDGRQIFVQTATPTGANEGDVWIKANIPFDLQSLARYARGEYSTRSFCSPQTLSPIYRLSNGQDDSDLSLP